MFWQDERKRVLIYIIFMFLMVGVFCFATCEPSQGKLKRIGEEAKEKYDAEYLPAFTEHIREVSGLDDLTVETSLLIYEDFYYRKYPNMAAYIIKYDKLYSDDIEQCSSMKEVRDCMNALLQELANGESFSYTLRNGMTVKVTAMITSKTNFRIYTSDNKEYWYWWHSDDFESITIDGSYVFFDSREQDSSSSESDTKSNTGSSGSTRSYYGWNDPYNVDAYDDPDDFANDYEDEFDDYDDAYDYWEEEHY